MLSIKSYGQRGEFSVDTGLFCSEFLCLIVTSALVPVSMVMKILFWSTL